MLMALLLVIGAQGAMATTYLKGNWDNWTTEHSADGATGVSITLDADKTYYFGIRDTGTSGTGNDWYTNSGTMSASNCSGWKFEKGSGNASITTTVAGTYVFKVTWQDNGSGTWYPYVSVIYPSAPAVNYYLKHNWGGNGWSWSEALTDNGDGTFSITKAYGGTGCDWNTSASDTDSKYIASPTVTGAPANGDDCVFTLNPTANTITITKKIAGPTVTFTPTAGSYTDAKNFQVTISGKADNSVYYCIVNKDGDDVKTETFTMSTASVTKTVYDAKENGTYELTIKNRNTSEVIATATYTIAIETKYDIAVYAYPNVGGTVTPNTTQKVGATGITITANPNTGYEFDGWTVTGRASVTSSSNPTTTLTATGDGTITAKFKESDDIYVYLTNDDNWSGDMYAYFFDGNGNKYTWPGTKMETDATYGYKVKVPEAYKNGYVIFNNNNGKQYPLDGYSGLAIRRTSHAFNNRSTVSGSEPVHNWQQVGSSPTRSGYNSITIYAYINNDMAWYPNKENPGQNGLLEQGTNFYIFAYVNPDNGSYHAFSTDDIQLTDNAYSPAYGKTAGSAANSYGDGADEMIYPVGYNGSSNLRYAKFVLYYPEAYEGKTAFYTINNGSLGTGQTNVNGNYQVRQLFDVSHNNIGDSYKGTPYYYQLPAITLENGSSHSLRLGFANNFMHQNSSSNGLNVENYQIESGSSDVSLHLFSSITIDDDYNCERNTDLRGRTFYDTESSTNVWESGVSYNIGLYRPFYCDGEYETICLPFDVSASEIEELFGEDTQIFEPYSISDTELRMTRIAKNDNATKFYLTAGKPYFIKPAIENRTDYNWGVGGTHGTAFTFHGKEMKYANTYVAYGQQLTYTDHADKTWQLKGCFIPTQIGGADRFVNISNSKIFYQQAYLDRSVIRGTRCFFYDSNDTPVTATTTTQKAKRIIIDGFDDETTAIVNPLNGNLIPVKNTKVYNMNGMYVGDNLSSLQKGIYIVDGKKYVVK